MRVKQPATLLIAIVALVLGLMLLTLSPLLAVFGMFIDGFCLCAYLMLQKSFWVEAVDRDGETWRLEWQRID